MKGGETGTPYSGGTQTIREKLFAALGRRGGQPTGPDPDPDQTAVAQAILMARARAKAQKAMAKVGRPGRGDGWPAGRKWAHRKTGQPDWFRGMKFRAERQKLLQKIPTASLVKDFKDARSFQDSYPNVWVLSQAKYEDLKGLPGVGPAKLKALRTFLSSRNVACSWKVPA